MKLFLFLFATFQVLMFISILNPVDAKTFYPYSPSCEDFEACYYKQAYPCLWNAEICNNGMGDITFICENVPNDGSASLSYDIGYPTGSILDAMQNVGAGNVEEGFTISVWNITDDSLTQSNSNLTNNVIMTNWMVEKDAQNRFDNIPLSEQCFNTPDPFAVGDGCLLDGNSSPRSYGPKTILGNGAGNDVFKVVVNRNRLLQNRCQTIISTISIN